MEKEALSTVIIKILLAILLFTGMGTIIIGGGYIIGEYYKNITSNQVIKPIDQEENYYDVLEKKCNNDGCCLASLKAMRENNYKEADENGKCPDNFNGSMMRCTTSLKWCEPIKEVEWESCDEDSDCETRFSHCDCRYQCVNKNIEADDCAVICDETGPIISRCVCENSKCIERGLDVSDWQTYQNEELGFEFKYPSEFGEVVFEITSEISLPVEGEKVGMKMEGTFSGSSLIFGGKTATYNDVSREITKIDFKGYIKNDDGYFFGIDSYQDELYGKMTPKKIINDDVLLVNCESFSKRCLIVDTYMSRTIDEDTKYSVAGLINLKENEFGGLMILANNRYNNKHHEYMDEDEFVEILYTFKFIESSR